MPRLARLDAPGALHRVIILGIETNAIFRNDKDRDAFLDQLGALLESPAPCYAWSLLSNHDHFLLRPRNISIDREQVDSTCAGGIGARRYCGSFTGKSITRGLSTISLCMVRCRAYYQSSVLAASPFSLTPSLRNMDIISKVPTLNT